jgi:hypothetical protein
MLELKENDNVHVDSRQPKAAHESTLELVYLEDVSSRF